LEGKHPPLAGEKRRELQPEKKEKRGSLRKKTLLSFHCKKKKRAGNAKKKREEKKKMISLFTEGKGGCLGEREERREPLSTWEGGGKEHILLP